MKRGTGKAFAMLVVLAAVTAGCADQITPADQPLLAPDVEVGGPFLSLSTTTTTVPVIKRTTPLAASITRSAVIGSTGGIVSIPEAGFRLIVPSGALSTSTTVSVTALAGDLVAYEFGPVGTKFAAVVTGEQNLAGTELAQSGDVDGTARGYFDSPDDIDYESGSATVSEVSQVNYRISGGKLLFYLNHFSGYVLVIP